MDGCEAKTSFTDMKEGVENRKPSERQRDQFSKSIESEHKTA
jgi:hypothetical protein